MCTSSDHPMGLQNSSPNPWAAVLQSTACMFHRPSLRQSRIAWNMANHEDHSTQINLNNQLIPNLAQHCLFWLAASLQGFRWRSVSIFSTWDLFNERLSLETFAVSSSGSQMLNEEHSTKPYLQTSHQYVRWDTCLPSRPASSAVSAAGHNQLGNPGYMPVVGRKQPAFLHRPFRKRKQSAKNRQLESCRKWKHSRDFVKSVNSLSGPWSTYREVLLLVVLGLLFKEGGPFFYWKVHWTIAIWHLAEETKSSYGSLRISWAQGNKGFQYAHRLLWTEGEG